MPRSTLLGAVIAGGRASRFGSDKALALLDGRPLIAHAAGVISPFVERVVVCGREWGGLVSLTDPEPDLGPLGGIATALGYADAKGFEGVVTIACDMPEVPGALVEALLGSGPRYCSDAPILGYWPAGLAGELHRQICAPAKAGTQTASPPLQGHIGKRRELSIRRWAEAIGAVAVPGPGLRNINTPADLA